MLPDTLMNTHKGTANMGKVPGRVFLDTCVVNFLLDHGQHIHDGVEPPVGLALRVRDDIEALRLIWVAGQRAQWQLAVSPYTYHEVLSTRSPERAGRLEGWFHDLWDYWREFLHSSQDLPSFAEAEEIRLRYMGSAAFDILPDIADRFLICDALVYGCDAFCTRDWSTVLRFRDQLRMLPIRILTPTEWWQLIQPWAGIWV